MPKKINIKGVIVSSDEKWIYDWFGIDAVSPDDVINELPTDNSAIEVIINSPGGDVYAGSEIYTTLKDYAGVSTGKIVGVAASAASVSAMGVDKLLMSPTAQIMIHNVQSGLWGDYRDMQHSAEVLKNWNTSIANSYQLKTGKTHDELLALMDNESWFTAQQALDQGLIDEIMFQNEAPKLSASLQSSILPQNVIDKIRNMKDKLVNIVPSGPEEAPEEFPEKDPKPEVNPEPQNNEKEALLFELDLI